MIPVWFVLEWFQRMLNEHWAYSWSGAQYGLVSCAGAWVYIYQRMGISIYHGSNTIWRKYTGRKGKLADVKAYMVPGWAVFKWRKDGEPEQYINDGEDDFYHMGCYVGPTEKYPEGAVIEAKGKAWGVVISSINDGWSHGAEMVKIDYSASQESRVGIVTAASGKTVNMRASPNLKAVIYKQVPIGNTVEVVDVIDGWAKIRYDKQTGYMLERYLVIEYDETDPMEEVKDHYIVLVTEYKGEPLAFDQAITLMDEHIDAGYGAEMQKIDPA